MSLRFIRSVATSVEALGRSRGGLGTKIVVSDLLEQWTEDRVRDMCAYDFARLTDPLLDAEYYEVLRAGARLESKRSEGGTSLERVREQLGRARDALA